MVIKETKGKMQKGNTMNHNGEVQKKKGKKEEILSKTQENRE